MVRNSRQLLQAPLPLALFRNSTCEFWRKKGSSTEQPMLLEARLGRGGEGSGRGKALPAQMHMGVMGPGEENIAMFGAWLSRGSF